MTHIQSIAQPGVSWCGQPLSDIIFHFKTLDQAAANGLFPYSRTGCTQCVTAAVQSLLNNNEVKNDEN